MGKMKELFIKQMNEEMENGYHDKLAESYYGHEPEPTSIDILCPNCMKEKLMFTTVNDIRCDIGCGQEFVLVDANTVKFK